MKSRHGFMYYFSRPQPFNFFKKTFFSFSNTMEFKIDTKENFSIIQAPALPLDANMAEGLAAKMEELTQNGSLNYIVDLEQVPTAGVDSLDGLSAMHESCYTQDKSLVFTQYNQAVLSVFREAGADDVLHMAPTMQEAIDIVSMEGLERMLDEWEEEEEEDGA